MYRYECIVNSNGVSFHHTLFYSHANFMIMEWILQKKNYGFNYQGLYEDYCQKHLEIFDQPFWMEAYERQQAA